MKYIEFRCGSLIIITKIYLRDGKTKKASMQQQDHFGYGRE